MKISRGFNPLKVDLHIRAQQTNQSSTLAAPGGSTPKHLLQQAQNWPPPPTGTPSDGDVWVNFSVEPLCRPGDGESEHTKTTTTMTNLGCLPEELLQQLAQLWHSRSWMAWQLRKKTPQQSNDQFARSPKGPGAPPTSTTSSICSAFIIWSSRTWGKRILTLIGLLHPAHSL